MYGTLKLDEILPQARPAGCEVVDIWPKPHGNQREQLEEMGVDAFAERLRKHNLALGILTRYDLGPFRLADEFKLLKRLGGRTIVCGGAGPYDVKGPQLKAAVRTFVEKLKPTLEAAAAAKATLAIENHGKNLICSVDSIKWLAELSGDAPLGIALAPYHLDQDAAAIAALIEHLGPKLAHFYAWQHGDGCMKPMPLEKELLQMPGRGPLDFAPIVAALRKINYAGWTSIFMHPTPRGRPILPTAQGVTEEINRARNYLDKLATERQETAQMDKVLIIVGDATETVDTLYPFYRLIEAGLKPVVAAPEKRRYQMVMHEVKPGWTITKEWEGYTIQADVAFKDIKEDEYLGIFFSGGRAPEYIRYDKDLMRITRHFFEANKPVASVCHGVEIPAAAGCVKGKRMATVPKCKFDLEVCGGTFVDEPCVIDGNLVSGRTFHDHGYYMGAWIKMLMEYRAKVG